MKPNGTKKQARRWGRKGGLIGGARRAAALTPERRSEIARMGALAKAAKMRAEQG